MAVQLSTEPPRHGPGPGYEHELRDLRVRVDQRQEIPTFDRAGVRA
jgi:hypothetical protein